MKSHLAKIKPYISILILLMAVGVFISYNYHQYRFDKIKNDFFSYPVPGEYSIEIKDPGIYTIYLNDKNIYKFQRDLMELEYPEEDLCLLRVKGYTMPQPDEILACFLLEENSGEKIKLINEKASAKGRLESVGVRLWRFNVIKAGKYSLKTEVFFRNVKDGLEKKRQSDQAQYFNNGLFLISEKDYGSAINRIKLISLIPFVVFMITAIVVLMGVFLSKKEISSGQIPVLSIFKVFTPLGRNSRMQFIITLSWIMMIQFQIFLYLSKTSQHFFAGGQVFHYLRNFFDPQIYYRFQISTGGIMVFLFNKIGSIPAKLLILTIIILAILNCFNFMKRLRDINWHAFWFPVLMVLYPLFSFCSLYIFGNSMAYRNTSPFKDYFYLAPVFLYGGYVLIAIFIILAIFLAIKKGTGGRNRFGADPLQPAVTPQKQDEIDLSEKQKRESRFRKMLFFSVAAFWFVLLIIMLIIYSSQQNQQVINKDQAISPKSQTQQSQKVAPDITVEDFNGKKVKLSDFRGKVVMLNFWATWCPPCRKEMPSMELLYDGMKDEDFVMMAVSMGEEKAKVKKFIDDNDYTFPVYLDKNRKASAKYSVTGIPTTLLIDKNGKIAYKKVGGEDWNSKENVDRIERLLRGASSIEIGSKGMEQGGVKIALPRKAVFLDFEGHPLVHRRVDGKIEAGQWIGEGNNKLFRFYYNMTNTASLDRNGRKPYCGYLFNFDPVRIGNDASLCFRYRTKNYKHLKEDYRQLKIRLSAGTRKIDKLDWFLKLDSSKEWKEVRLPLKPQARTDLTGRVVGVMQLTSFSDFPEDGDSLILDLDDFRIESVKRKHGLAVRELATKEVVNQEDLDEQKVESKQLAEEVVEHALQEWDIDIFMDYLVLYANADTKKAWTKIFNEKKLEFGNMVSREACKEIAYQNKKKPHTVIYVCSAKYEKSKIKLQINLIKHNEQWYLWGLGISGYPASSQ
ncbi:TlpA family protein disulfide reductase [Candidatus Margulisiibacteriota bacterium]